MKFFVFLIIILLSTIILGLFIINKLKKLKLEQTIRDDGPSTHLQKKGTPSMGGLIFLIPVGIIGTFYLPSTLLPLLALLGYAALGIYDDLDKRVINNSGGLTIPRKLMLEILIGIIVSVISIVFLKDNIIGISKSGIFAANGIIYTIFIIIFFISVTNAVNFTDGLDGLATMVSIPIFILFIFISLHQGNIALARFCGVIVASLIGFLVFNFHPAKIFMGDTGSLALGALVAAIAIILNVELLLLIFGFIYFIEAISVLIQIVYFRKTNGGRFFKMAPLHHHFELSGWSELKVVFTFTLASVGLSVLAYIIYILF